MIEKIRQKAKEAREKLISGRALVEREVATFAENIAKVDPALIAHIALPKDGISARSVFPSLYMEVVDVEQYKKELLEFSEFLTEYDKVRNKLIIQAEAMING